MGEGKAGAKPCSLVGELLVGARLKAPASPELSWDPVGVGAGKAKPVRLWWATAFL